MPKLVIGEHMSRSGRVVGTEGGKQERMLLGLDLSSRVLVNPPGL